MVITICGSSKFKTEILDSAKNLTLDDHIVFVPTIFEHADNEELTEEQKLRLDNLHKMKINMSDAIFVVNVDKYVGPSTFSDIDWAVRNKKEVYFLVNPKDTEEEDNAEESSAENVEAEKVD